MKEGEHKTKKRNPKEELAAHYYLDPQSETYLNKTKSLVKAGYSKSYALGYPKRIQEICNFADILPDGVKTPQEDIKNWQNLAEKARKELEKEPKLIDKGSKFLAEINRMLDLKMKHYGYKPPDIKEQRIIKIELPKGVIEEEYRRRGDRLGGKTSEGRTEVQE